MFCSNFLCLNVACLCCLIPRNTVGCIAGGMSCFTEFFRLMVGLDFFTKSECCGHCCYFFLSSIRDVKINSV